MKTKIKNDKMKEKLIEYYLQEYSDNSPIIQRIKESESFYLEKQFGELIVSVIGDSRLILPRAIFLKDPKKGTYDFYPIPDDIMNELNKL